MDQLYPSTKSMSLLKVSFTRMVAHMAAPMHSRPTTKALFRLPTGATRKVKA